MPTFRLLTAACTLSILGAVAPALADKHPAERGTEHTQPSNTEGSHSDIDFGGSVQVPNAGDGAAETNPYDDVGLDDMNSDADASQVEGEPVNESGLPSAD